MKYEAIFFDLDGTLIGLEMDHFLPDYLAQIRSWTWHLSEDGGFMDAFGGAVQAMLTDGQPHMTNEEVFFCRLLAELPHLERREMQRLFSRFYREEFPRLRRHCTPIAGVPGLLRRLRRTGYRQVLATNPLFPREAVVQRMRWGGLRPRHFSYISTYENSRYCKPHPLYYRDLLATLQVEADRVIMVGNDPVEDLAAAEAGIDTYLLEGYVVDRGEAAPEPQYRGSLRDLQRLLLN